MSGHCNFLKVASFLDAWLQPTANPHSSFSRPIYAPILSTIGGPLTVQQLMWSECICGAVTAK